MRTLDWVVLVGALVSIVSYGLYKSRGSRTVNLYLLAGKTLPWWTVALSIMATQASAVTFISIPGQSFVDGMRFVQYYFGLPLAMVILSATAVPIFHRANVYTAYEYLEQRFDAKTRALASIIFLIQRGLAAGLTLYAPAIVLAVILRWPDRVTTLIIGAIVIAYTVTGGVKAIAWTDVQQMLTIFTGLTVALFMVVHLMPADVSFRDAVHLAGSAGKLNAVDLSFDWQNRYNIWSGLIGGMFLALSYFGCDQSQVQRYLTGRSIAQSKLSLMFNAMAKVPMQFFILFIGAMVFVFYLFEQPPVLFQETAAATIQSSPRYPEVASTYQQAFEKRRDAAKELVESRRAGDEGRHREGLAQYRLAQKELEGARGKAIGILEEANGKKGFNDTNYIFLTFVTGHLPPGLVGLIIAVIFCATMSAISAEVSSLATVSVIDIYTRHIRREASDRHYLLASRLATAFWGVYAVVFSQYGKNLGSLVEAVNILGSLFYGSLLGVFILAFFFKRVAGTAAFLGMLAGEAAILCTFAFTKISAAWW